MELGVGVRGGEAVEGEGGLIFWGIWQGGMGNVLGGGEEDKGRGIGKGVDAGCCCAGQQGGCLADTHRVVGVGEQIGFNRERSEVNLAPLSLS